MSDIIKVTGPEGYPVLFTANLREDLPRAIREASFNRRIALVVDRVLSREAEAIARAIRADLFLITATEEEKSFTTVEAILSFLMAHDYRRQDALISFGGGITSDVTGLASGLYKRGIAHAVIATTTLAMADAAIGGKCAVNFGGVKNSAGIFKNPSFVLCALETLPTLDAREVSNGLYEAVKTGLVLDRELFRLFEQGGSLTEELERSARVKASLVSRDPHEAGERKLLNFGHTIGHAIEATHLGEIKHGEAVAYGMLRMIDDASLRERACAVFTRLGLDAKRTFDAQPLMAFIREDKKVADDGIDAVIVREEGKGAIVRMSFAEIAERIGR